MPAKIILSIMLVILPILYVLSNKLRKRESKNLKFERFFFKRLQEEKGSLEKIENEVIQYGKSLGLKDDKISNLIRENSL